LNYKKLNKSWLKTSIRSYNNKYYIYLLFFSLNLIKFPFCLKKIYPAWNKFIETNT
jgi:hypothetical protein